jgi:diaminobutyrate-2-oxoglutarate transaminase
MTKLFDKSFTLLWLGETAFDLGAALLGFALGVRVFEETASIQQFSWVILSAAVPALVCMPISGLWADRYNRRVIILGCDLAAVALIAVMALLSLSDRLVVEYLYMISAFSAVIGSLRNPSYMAVVSQIVPQDQLTRANGVVQGTHGVLQIGAPMATGYLLALGGLTSVVLVNLTLAIGGMFAVYAALTSAKHATRATSKGEAANLRQGVSESLGGVIRYFRERTPMRRLLVYILLQEALVVLVSVLVMPMILSHHGSTELGIVMSSGAVGAVSGALLLAVLNPRGGLMRYVIVSNLGLSFFVIVAGITHSISLWSMCAFFAFAFAAVSDGCANSLWMRKVPKKLRGSLFAVVPAANMLIMIIVLLLGGWLIEHVLEPAMMLDGALANLLGPYLGVGQGRGLAVVFVMSGVLVAARSLIALVDPSLKGVDELEPDQDSSGKDDSSEPSNLNRSQ